ncbi:unnamed protein product [Echinostoma caproni]|uniref:VWFA domain-containing protein n=1 Tax=Echinostoma caproni TaxID=27848 RepID=A0A183A566_9TREM|nr:unnamed protein product [Echinostoma caproni]
MSGNSRFIDVVNLKPRLNSHMASLIRSGLLICLLSYLIVVHGETELLRHSRSAYEQRTPEDALTYSSLRSYDIPEPLANVTLINGEDQGMTTSAISLAIVFDSTGSMGNDLKQVKIGARRILQRHMQRGEANYIKDFVLVKVHDPDVGPARVTTSTKTFYHYLDSVYTQGGGDCPEMTITGIELALEASRPNSLIYVFTDSSAKDYNRTSNVLNLIQQKQSQVVFVLTGFCNSTDEPGFEAYRQIATVSSGQLYIIGKGQVNEFMQVVEAAVEARKVHVLQQDTWGEYAKTYSFPVDAHLTQLTIHVTNHRRSQSIDVRIRNPEGKLIGTEDGLKRLMKAVSSVFVGSIDRPAPGEWTLEVSTKLDEAAAATDVPKDTDESLDQQAFSVRISGISDVDFLQGFATTPHPFNYGASRQPIGGVKNYIMVNMTGRFQPGRIDHFDMRSPNGTSLSRLPVKHTPNTQIYVSQHPVDPLHDHAYLQVSGRDSQGFAFQRYSKVALSGRKPRPIVITCPAKVELQRGATSDLSCFVSSEVPYTIKWYKDGKYLGGRPDENKVYNFASDVMFTIADANEDSHGIYSAEVVPTVAASELKIEGEYKDEVAVVILPPPPRVLVPRNTSVEPGANAVLTCNVFSLDEDVQIRWFRGLEPRFELKEGRRYRVETQQAAPPGGPAQAWTSKLTITAATKSDAGRYVCEAEHKGGVSEADGFLHIHVLPQVSTTTEEITFKDGGSLVVTCLAEGVPQPKISWLFNKVPITISGVDQSRITVHEDDLESRLIIQPANEKDAGQYTCVATNSAGNSTSTITASFISVPKIDKLEMSNLSPVVGKGQTFTCHVSGQPKPRVKWEFNGSPVTTGTQIRIDEEQGKLDLLVIDQRMKGEWTCIAENLAGATRESIQLEVGSPPKIRTDVAISKVLAEFSMDATLTCPVTGQPTPAVKWYRVTASGNVPIKYGDRYQLQKDNSLYIEDVNMEDGGTFVCEAANMYGKISHSVTVEIGGTKAPSISFTQPKQVALQGLQEKRLNCNVLDAKPAATVMWLKDNQPIDFGGSSKYSLDKYDLIIRDIRAKDEGIYTCIARNVVGKAKFDIELDVQAKPSFLDPDSGKRIEVTQGDNLVLECQVEGDPKPTVEWRKDGRRILPHGPTTAERGIGNGNGATGPAVVVSPDGYTLTVYSVNDAVAGSFTCSAINIHSVETKEFRVTVKTPPIISKDGPSEFELGQQEVGLLTCLVTASQPPATVRWFKNGQPLVPVPGRITLLDNGHTVEVRGKVEDDSGSFECRAENEAGTDSRFYQVTILVPPTVTTRDKITRRLVGAGHTVEIECGMTGYPEPRLTWQWNGKPLTTTGIGKDGAASNLGIQVVQHGPEQSNLIIRDMNSALQGNFTCIGTNKGGSTEIVYEVIALEKPTIEDFHEKAVVFVNNTITLTCEASGSPPPKITWFFQGQPLDLNKTYGYRDRHMAQNLTVKTIEIGGNITFTCVMSSNPPAQIKWLKDEKDIFSMMPQGPKNLMLLSASPYQGGEYTCVAENEAGSAKATTILTVFDRFSISPDGSMLTLLDVRAEDQGEFKCVAINIPGSWNYRYTLEVTSSPGILRHSSSQSRIDVNRGQDLRLQCLATANPEPVYQWLKDETPLTMRVLALGDDVVDSKSVRTNTTGISTRFSIHDNGRLLIVQNVQPEDAGRYTCVASNPVGEDRLEIAVTVSSAPNFPDGEDHESPVMERGKANSLWCNATGYPDPEIRWEYLYLNNVQSADAGNYRCVVTNEYGKARRQWAVEVMLPSHTNMPRLSALIALCSLIVFCHANNEPKSDVKWFKWHTDGQHGYDIVSNFKSPLFGQMIGAQREDKSAMWGGRPGDRFGGPGVRGAHGEHPPSMFNRFHHPEPFFDWAHKHPNGKASGSVLIVATTKEVSTENGKSKTDEYGSVRNEHFGDKDSGFYRSMWGPMGFRRWNVGPFHMNHFF